jgi:hypothetical protein
VVEEKSIANEDKTRISVNEKSQEISPKEVNELTFEDSNGESLISFYKIAEVTPSKLK